jgi:hypothetical protein
MQKIIFIVLFVASLLKGSGQTIHGPIGLRVDLLLGDNNGGNVQVNSHIPRFSWQADTSVKLLTAYRIQVASSQALLDSGMPDVWDSKKINSTHSYAMYAGNALKAGKYYWKMQLWNEKNKLSSFSTVSAFFFTGAVTDTVSHRLLTYEWQQPVDSSRQENGTYFFDFGKEAFGQLAVQVESAKNDTIIVEIGEMANGNSIEKNGGKSVRYNNIKIPVSKGLHIYEPVWPPDEKRNSRSPVQMPDYTGEVYPFRYITIRGSQGMLRSATVKRKMVYYPFDETASSFISSDTILNKVWDLCKYTIKATSYSGFYVDGDRERIPYEADALINQLSHYAVDAEYSIARRTMAYLLYHPTWPTEWFLQNVLLAWNDYLYTGDISFLEKYYPELQKKTLMPLADANGLISTRIAKQTDAFLQSLHKKVFDGRYALVDIIDWPQSGIVGPEKEYPGETDGFVFTTYNSVVNAFYYRNLLLMEKIARALHRETDANRYAVKSAQVFRSFQQVFCDEKNGLVKDGDGTNHSSLHANMFALAFGLVQNSDVSKVAKYIQSRKMACSVYGAQFLLDGLYDAGQDKYALQLLTATSLRSWYNMIRVGATITLEAWDKLYKPNLDMNHAWGSAPANLIVRKLMGVEPLTPGCERIRIKPQPGDLSFAQLTTSTIKGKLHVSFNKTAEAVSFDVIIPGATTADIYLPVTMKNTRLFVDERLFPAKIENGFFVIPSVMAGKHHFRL